MILLLPPTAVVEVIESVPSVCLSRFTGPNSSKPCKRAEIHDAEGVLTWRRFHCP